MSNDLDKLRYDIDQLNIANDEKEVMLESIGKTEKELKTLNFRLDRALKEKNKVTIGGRI